jgi:hypothetical protein
MEKGPIIKTMTDTKNNSDRIDRLIAFFKSLKVKKPQCDNPDYSSWNQTEEQYQEEQARWLEEVRRKKKNGGKQV